MNMVSDVPTGSPVNQAAGLALVRVNARAVSIYEKWPNEEKFFLTGCVGWSPGFHGPAPELVAPVLDSDGAWRGMTSFVAFENSALRIANTRDGALATRRDGTRVRLKMDATSCEIANPGPFLAVPILAGDQDVLGVIRALRCEGDPTFEDEEEERLEWIARFLALSFIQERMRAKLIEGLMSIATCGSESDAVERIAHEAQLLLNNPSAVFLRAGTAAPARYVFRAPQRLSEATSQTEYTSESTGYTPLVLFQGRSDVLSLNLPKDTAEGGALHGVGHQSKPAELGEGEAQSLVIVPIPGPRAGGAPAGAIRSSSRQPYAFSRREVETMRALASQADVVLTRHRERKALQTIVDTSPRPILAIDSAARVTTCNDAVCDLLKLERDQIIGRRLLEVVYAGKKNLARANEQALRNAGDDGLRDHYTTIYRESSQGSMTIPVRVDASFIRSESGQIEGVVAYLEDLRGPDVAPNLTCIGQGHHLLMTADPDTVREVQRIRKELNKDTRQHIVIRGETGVGKELLAYAAAAAMGRPFAFYNCAGLEEEIFEAEFFGVDVPIATGVPKGPGLIRSNPGATFVLDEVQELSPRIQAKLLRALDAGRIRPMGGKEIAVDLHVVALTNADLEAMESKGRFRSDLKHRLLGITFQLKPLRDRRPDILQIADHFLATELQGRATGPQGFSSNAIRAMLAYGWPGNIRELRETIRQAVARSLAASSPPWVIPVSALPEKIRMLADGQDAARGTGRRQRIALGRTTIAEKMSELEQRMQALESVVPPKAKANFGDVLSSGLEADGGLRARLVQGGVEELLKYFQERTGQVPGKSRAYQLLKDLGLTAS